MTTLAKLSPLAPGDLDAERFVLGTAILKSALHYASQGWAVFPVHSVDAGRCSCGRVSCGTDNRNAGKHPRVEHGLLEATTDQIQIAAWWARWPNANVALVTGARSHLVVLDVDPEKGGDASLDALVAQHGPLPPTPEALTGGGGRHLLFAHPGRDLQVRNSASGLGPGLDVREDGGDIVAPPSGHRSGRLYEWETSSHPDDVPLAALPAWLLSRVTAQTNGSGAQAEPVTEVIPDGKRNATLTSLAGTLRRRGLDTEELLATLRTVNVRRCSPPLTEDELQTIAGSVGRYDPVASVFHESSPEAGRRAIWAATPAPDFVNAPEQPVAWLREPILAPGSVTQFFAPRGLGKTQVAYGLAIELARQGLRILLLDRDNSQREIRRRLKAWGAGEAAARSLEVKTRDEVPPLTDRAAWAAFPFNRYDFVIVDSLDSSTEGVGEQDSTKPSRAIAPILDIAHRADGPAILVLGNTIKSAEHSRGSGVVEDRADIVYEVRDATDLRPTGSKSWWLELPAAGAAAWGERSARRKRRDAYRLAFTSSKFRIGEEPDPFILEIDLSSEPWQLRDVTAEVVAAGEQLEADTARARLEVRERAAIALAGLVADQEAIGVPLQKSDAEAFLLKEQGLKRDAAREVVQTGDGRFWRIDEQRQTRGRPKVLRPISAADANPAGGKVSDRDGGNNRAVGTLHQEGSREAPISAARLDTGPQQYPLGEPASELGIVAGGLFPPSHSDTPAEVAAEWFSRPPEEEEAL